MRLGDFVPPDITAQAEPVDEPSDDEPVNEPPSAEPVEEPTDAGEATPHARWTGRYRAAHQLIQGDGDSPPNFARRSICSPRKQTMATHWP